MLKKKLAVTIASIAAASFILGTMLNVNLLTTAKEEGESKPVWETYVTGVNATALPDVWNANVMNWPEPQKPIFAEILVLRGLVHNLQKAYVPSTPWDRLGVLVDENMPNLPRPHRFILNQTTLYGDVDIPTEWEKQPDDNFTYVPANSRFFIQGEATIVPTISYYFESTDWEMVYFDIVVHLEKVNPEGTTILSSDTISLHDSFDGQTSATLDGIGVILDIPWPVVVNPNERLQIRFETFVRCENGYVQFASIELFHTLGTDEFIAYIPILPS